MTNKWLVSSIVLMGCATAVMAAGPAAPETSAGWKKFEGNPVMGGKYGTCFDISVLREGDELPHVALLAAQSEQWRWSRARTASTGASRRGSCSARSRETGWEDDINRPVVLKRGDTYHMWYSGSRPRAFVRSATPPAADGIAWKRMSDRPVLSPEQPWEKVAVMCPHVLWDEQAQLFRMWYSGGEQNEPNAIGYATSPDGLTLDEARRPTRSSCPTRTAPGRSTR